MYNLYTVSLIFHSKRAFVLSYNIEVEQKCQNQIELADHRTLTK